MNVTEAMKAAGYKPEKSTAGDKFIFKGVYRCSFFDVAKMEDKGYGESIYAQFKIQEVLGGAESFSKFPEFKKYFQLGDKIANKKSGLAALINGLFSVGLEVDTSNLLESLASHKGADVFINAYGQEPRKLNEDTEEWEDDPDGEVKQAFNFMTKENAEKKAAKSKDAKPF